MESEHEDKAKETVNDTADDTKAESLQSVNALLWQQHSQTSLSESSPPISTTGRPPLGPSPLSRSNSKQQGLVMSTLEEDNISKSEGTLLHSHKEDSKKSFPPVEDSPPKVISESENPKRRSSKLSHEPSALVMNTHLTPEQIQGYMVYTHTQSIPKKGTTLREYRSIFRLLQALTSAGAFATIFYSSIVNAHQSFVLSESGVSLMCLTSISAFVSLFYKWVRLVRPHLTLTPLKLTFSSLLSHLSLYISFRIISTFLLTDTQGSLTRKSFSTRF